MLLNHRPTKILITGKSSSGKSTYWTRYILNSFRVRYGQIFIFDHEGEFAFRNGIQPCYNSDDLERAYPGGLLCFDPVEQFPGQTFEAFDWFCGFVFELRRWIIRNAEQPEAEPIALFACDELQKLTDVYSLAQSFATLLETGRRYGIDTLFIGQQINLIHNRIRNQATECVTFNHVDPMILAAMQDWGFNPDEVAALEFPGEYLLKSFVGGNDVRGHLFKKGGEKKSSKPIDKPTASGEGGTVDAPPPSAVQPEAEQKQNESEIE